MGLKQTDPVRTCSQHVDTVPPFNFDSSINGWEEAVADNSENKSLADQVAEHIPSPAVVRREIGRCIRERRLLATVLKLSEQCERLREPSSETESEERHA